MASEPENDQDILVGDARTGKLVQDRWKDLVARQRTCDVAGDDRDLFARPDDIAKRCAFNRVKKGPDHLVDTCQFERNLIRSKDGEDVFFLNGNVDRSFSESE